jgi:hypothetical protein
MPAPRADPLHRTKQENSKEGADDIREVQGSQFVGFAHELVGVRRARHGRRRARPPLLRGALPRFLRLLIQEVELAQLPSTG